MQRASTAVRRFRIYWQIVLPQVRPALATLALLTFVFQWNEFLWPLVVVSTTEMRPITTGLTLFHSGNLHPVELDVGGRRPPVPPEPRAFPFHAALSRAQRHARWNEVNGKGSTQWSKSPNVIVVLTDQQRWDTVGAHGNPMELTPNFDRLARTGLFVKNSFTCQPVCGPARSAFQTGRLPNADGLLPK